MLARVLRPIPKGAVTIPISKEPIDVSGWLNVDSLVKTRYIELVTIPVTPEMLYNTHTVDMVTVPVLEASDPLEMTEADDPQSEEEPALEALAKPRGRPRKVTDN